MEFNIYCEPYDCLHELSEIIFYESPDDNSYFWAICSNCGKQFNLPTAYLDDLFREANT